LKTSNLTAAVAAIMMATAPFAFAQSAAATHGAATMANPTGNWIKSDQFRASKMIGSTVYDVQNRDIGSVKDLIVDRDGRVAAAVVGVGGGFLGSGGKYVAVPLSDLKSDNNRLTLNMTKEELQQAEEYHLTNNNTGAGSSTSPVTGGHLGSASGTNR
jgi:sporulation protein YlmC with PRC-barrel domain